MPAIDIDTHVVFEIGNNRPGEWPMTRRARRVQKDRGNVLVQLEDKFP